MRDGVFYSYASPVLSSPVTHTHTHTGEWADPDALRRPGVLQNCCQRTAALNKELQQLLAEAEPLVADADAAASAVDSQAKLDAPGTEAVPPFAAFNALIFDCSGAAGGGCLLGAGERSRRASGARCRRPSVGCG